MRSRYNRSFCTSFGDGSVAPAIAARHLTTDQKISEVAVRRLQREQYPGLREAEQRSVLFQEAVSVRSYKLEAVPAKRNPVSRNGNNNSLFLLLFPKLKCSLSKLSPVCGNKRPKFLFWCTFRKTSVRYGKTPSLFQKLTREIGFAVSVPRT